MLLNFGQSKKPITLLNELEINGQNVDDEENEDYTISNTDDSTDDDNDLENMQDNEPDDDTDYTTEQDPDLDGENPDDTPETGATDDEPEGATEPVEDETVDTDAGSDEAGGDGNEGDNDLIDFTEEEDDSTDDISDDDTVDAGADDSGSDDYTEMGDENETGEENAEGSDSGEGETSGEESNGSNDETGSEGGDSADANTIAEKEKVLFSDLTPQQMAIKNTELLQNYIDMHDALNSIFDNINKIPKTYNNTRAIEFVGQKVVELKDMVNYIITDTYVTKTYIENMVTYKQCLLMLQQINTMLKGLVQKPVK